MPFTNIIESGSATNRGSGTNYAFSVSLVSGRLYIFFIGGQMTTAATGLWGTVTSDGVDSIDELVWNNLAGAPQLWATSYMIQATETNTRNITVPVGGSGLTCAQAIWTVDELPAGEFNTSDPIVEANDQVFEGSAETAPSITFGAASSPGAIFWGGMRFNRVATDIACTAGTELGETEIESRTINTAQIASGSGSTLSWSIAAGSSGVVIGHEIAGPPSKALLVPSRRLHRQRLIVR